MSWTKEQEHTLSRPHLYSELKEFFFAVMEIAKSTPLSLPFWADFLSLTNYIKLDWKLGE